MKPCIVTCHGFTGYPEEMEPIGKYLHNHGFDWVNLQLPGHGTTPEDLKDKKWTDWTSYTLNEVDRYLREYNNNVIMLGLSLGGTLTLYALINRPQLRAGICLSTPVNVVNVFQKILLNIPFFGLWMKNSSTKEDIFDPEMKKTHKSYQKFHSSNGKQLIHLLMNVKSNLSKIKQPILIIHSKNDQVVHFDNANYIFRKVCSSRKELYFVDQSSHVLTKDFDRERVYSKSLEFINDLETFS